MFKNNFIRRAGVAAFAIGLWTLGANASAEPAGSAPVPGVTAGASTGSSSFQALIPGIYAFNAAVPPGDPAVRRKAIFNALTAQDRARFSLLGVTFAEGDAVTLAAAPNEPSETITRDEVAMESRSSILQALSNNDELIQETRKSSAGGKSASANAAAKLIEMASKDEIFAMDGAAMSSLYDLAETDSQSDSAHLEVQAELSLGTVSHEPLKWPLLWAVCGAAAMGGLAYIMEIVARRRSW